MNELANYLLMSLKSHVAYVYIFMFIVSFLESFAFLGLVVPGAAIVVTAGFLASKGYFNIYWLVVFSVVGAILADVASFVLGVKYSKYVVKTKIYVKYKNYFVKGEYFFKKYGGISVFFGRFFGFLRPVIPFVAGMSKMSVYVFFIWAVASGILWGILYIGFGYYSAKGLVVLNNFVGNADYIVGLVIMILAIIYVLKSRITKNH